MKLLPNEFENLVNISPEGIYISDALGDIHFGNDAFYQLIGYNQNDQLNIFNIINEEFIEIAHQTNKYLFENAGVSRNLTVAYNTKNGIKWIDSLTSVQIINQKAFRVAFVRDVSAMHKQQEELINLNKRLREYVFLTSHKLRHPIANIIGLVDLFNYTNTNASENLIILESLSKSANILNQVVYELHQTLSNSLASSQQVAKTYTNQISKIMLIDDDQINNFINKTAIQKINKSINVLDVKSAMEALELLRNKAFIPDLILLDLMMPIMSGWDFVEEFKNMDCSNIKLCILTTSIDTKDIEKSHSYGFKIDFISKPLTTEKITRLITSDKDNFLV